MARLLEEQSHVGWDTVEGFYVWRVIGLFPVTLLGGLEGLRHDERHNPKTQQKKRKKNTFYTSVSETPVHAQVSWGLLATVSRPHTLTLGVSSPQIQYSPPLCSAPSPVKSAPAAFAAGT